MNFNYSQLLALDSAVSVVSTQDTKGRKLTDWAGRISETDYPASFVLQFIESGDAYTMKFVSETDGLVIYENTAQTVKCEITIAEALVTDVEIYEKQTVNEVTAYAKILDTSSLVEGEITTSSGKALFYDPSTVSGDKAIRLSYEGIPRAALTEEMTDWVYASMGIITDQTVKGLRFDGRWRLVGITSGDRDNPSGNESISLTMTYKKGCAKTLNHDEARLMNKADFKSASSKLLLKFPNLDPLFMEEAKASYDPATELTDPCFGGVIYEGTWTIRRSVSLENAEDGSGEIILMLTKPGNEDCYFTYAQTPTTLKGHYFKWDTTEAQIKTLLNTTKFNSAGQIFVSGSDVGYYTLSAVVPGRTISVRSMARDDNTEQSDFLYDVEVQIEWVSAAYYKDENTALLAPDTKTTDGSYGIVDPKKILRFGTVGREIKDEFGVETDKLPVFDYEDSDLTDGLYKTTTRLMGIQSQIPELTPSKKWNWRLNTEKITVPSAAWFVHAIGREWKKLVTPKTLSWQQIRRMIGGDLAFNKNQETGALTGVDWNEDFDDAGGDYPRAAAPDIWISHGYQRRYGPWKPYWKQGYLMGPGSIRTNASGGVICRGPLNGYDFYQIGDVVWDGSAFKVLSGATEWSAAGGNIQVAPTNNELGAVLKSGNKVYTCINASNYVLIGSNAVYAYVTPPNSPDGRYFFSEGAQYGTGKLVSANFSAFDSSLVVSKIAISGGGEAPFEQPDLYIPVVQIVSDEVDWDLDWEWNATSTYANGQVRFFLEDGLVYEAVDSPAAGESPSDEPTKWTATTTKNPTGWDADGRNTRYGDWSVAWSKGYLTGAGSIKTNTLGASQCKGFYVATSDYQLGDVVWNDSNSDFEIASSATEWSAAGGNIQVAPTNNELGAVLKSGNKVYTCINASNYVLIGSNAVYAYVTPPNSPDGRYFFSEGGIGSEITWVSFDRDYIVSKIASKGIGLAPFETVERIGVIDASSGYAAAPSARVSFYTNPHENPECFEAGHRVRRHEDVIVLRTYFAIDPIWVTNRRIPDDISQFGNSLFHLEDPNVFAEYKTIQVGDLYAIELIITRIGEYEADELTSSSDPNEGATVDGNGKTQMNGSPRNYPQVDRDGYWGVYHRIPAVDRLTRDGGVSGRPDGAYKDVG